jgi:prevent-host-death family protein
MQQHVSLRDANQHLARYVKVVESGDEVIITRRGRPVAKLIPIAVEKSLNVEQQAAMERTLARMQNGYSLGGQATARDELYER